MSLSLVRSTPCRSATLERDPEARHLSPEGGRADIERLRGALAAAVVLTESGFHRVALRLVHDVGEGAPGGPPALGRRLRQDVVLRDYAPRAERHRLLHHVLELAHVAWELVRHEP